ncbi:MAG TPA: hypothetical protein VLA44_04180 [Clostridia bacterium]|nr:hypothetical protein [Clostridia bacterium]
MDTFGRLIGTTVDGLVRVVVVPVTSLVPRLVSSGLALVLYAAIWIAVGIALVTNPAALDEAWRTIGALALPLQALVWLLFLPVMAGLWAWGTDWPEVVRLVVMAGLAGWSVLIFIPRNEGAAPAGAQS